MILNRLARTLLGALLVIGVISQARAEDKKVDPTGTYVWTMPGRNGGADRTNTLVLKMEGEKLAGKMVTPGRGGQTNETEISETKIEGANISFAVTREFNGNKFTAKYSGKVEDGAIKGKIETERNGETRSREWEAKLEKK